MTSQGNAATSPNYTVTDLGTVTLGRTTYQVERMIYTSGDLAGKTNTTLTGPRGATYFLRGFLGEDTGLRQIISWKSGNPLRDSRTQAEIRVYEIGDVIEVAPKTRPTR